MCFVCEESDGLRRPIPVQVVELDGLPVRPAGRRGVFAAGAQLLIDKLFKLDVFIRELRQRVQPLDTVHGAAGEKKRHNERDNQAQRPFQPHYDIPPLSVTFFFILVIISHL